MWWGRKEGEEKFAGQAGGRPALNRALLLGACFRARVARWHCAARRALPLQQGARIATKLTMIQLKVPGILVGSPNAPPLGLSISASSAPDFSGACPKPCLEYEGLSGT